MDIAAIRQMGPGTDVHGVVQRVAYRLWEKGGGRGGNADENWLLAQERFAEFSRMFRYMDTAEGFHEYILDVAHFLKASSPDKRWLKALDEVAERAFNMPYEDAILVSLRPLRKKGYNLTL